MDPIKLLFQDKNLCVINKDYGHVVHRTAGAGKSPIILQALRDQVGQKIYPVHRLDRGTSGCLAFAFSSKVAKGLQEQLQSDSTIKKYTALCHGKLPDEGFFDRELSNEKKVKQKAYTKYRVVREYEKQSLLELQILTGRKHQIRRHLSFEGHHIVGDVQHGKGWLNNRFRENYDFRRMFLHCHYFSFIHPVSGERINIHCDLDTELSDLLLQLK